MRIWASFSQTIEEWMQKRRAPIEIFLNAVDSVHAEKKINFFFN